MSRIGNLMGGHIVLNMLKVRLQKLPTDKQQCQGLRETPNHAKSIRTFSF